MRETKTLPVLLTCALVLAGCNLPRRSGAAPAPPRCKTAKVWSSVEAPPGWLYQEPELKQGKLFFVGLSENHVTEAEGREMALRNARKNVVQFVGTEVRDKFERLMVSMGLSSEVVDPTQATKEFEEQFSQGMARRVKASEWYLERWEKKGCPVALSPGSYYKVYVMARVPQREIDKATAEQERRQRAVLAAAKAANEKLALVKDAVIEAENREASEPVLAVAGYRKAIKMAEGVKVSIQAYPELGGIAVLADGAVVGARKGIDRIRDNPWAVFVAAVQGLTKDAKKPARAAVGKAAYQDTELSSEFSNYLTSKLEWAMSRDRKLYRVVSQKVFRRELSRAKLSLEACLEGDFGPHYESLKFLPDLHSLMMARYWDKGDEVEVKIELVRVGTGEVLGATSVPLDKAKARLPTGISYDPANESLVDAAKAVFGPDNIAGSGLKVKVWPDKGEGAVYRGGDAVRFNFRSNKDTYLYLYHMDTTGRVKMLFPNSFNDDNRIEAGLTYSIPDDTMNFDFQITPPFGSEVVKAVASLQPLRGMDVDRDAPFRDFGKITDARTQRVLTRGIGTVARRARAESTCVVTTIKR